MAGEIDENVVLDYAVFQISPSQNSYEAFVCSKGSTEKLATGPLDQLMLHLREVLIQSDSSFKLQVIESLNGSSWFTKLTIGRFLHIVNLPEVLKITFAIANEMTQLEETREFQIALYSKGHVDHAGGGTDCLKEGGLMHKIKVSTTSSDDTKNELLRAMDLRLAVLKEELVVSFDRAAGAVCSTKQISDLAAFTQYFGAIDLRSFMSKYLELIAKVQLSPASVDPKNSIGNKLEEILQLDLVKSSTNGISPAKTAQAERRSSTESEEGSSDSSDEDQSFAERSRPAIRSASPKRSASPMRRVQIGRSGSRRSTALTIKSLNYFPARERTTSIRDGANSDDEESNQPPKKPDNAVRRMSVQDAINLFESKQKDQNVDVQKRKTSAEVSVTAKKSVLRRWSAGMTDSFAPENATDTGSQSISRDLLPLEAEEKRSTEVEAEEKRSTEVEVSEPSEMDKMSSPPKDNPPVMVLPIVEEICDRTLSSSEWSRQKEAELNQMLMKMMENKPGKYRGAKTGSDVFQEISSEQRSGFHTTQYKEKKKEKLRAENGRVRAQYKMEETLDLSKAKNASKTGKQDQMNQAQRPRRNSSPPLLPKKEVPKAISSKRTPSKSSTGMRNSWSSGPLPRTTGTPSAKPSPGSISSNSAPNRRLTPSPRPLQQAKANKGALTDAKPSSREQRAVAKTSTSTKSKILSANEDDSGVKSAKPSFYSKVAKRSSVVPLEPKPFLRKRTGIGPVLAKTKVSQSDDSSKNSGNLVQADMASETAASISKIEDNVGLEAPVSVGNGLIHEAMEEPSQSSDAVENSLENSVELPVSEIQHGDDVCISSSAWVEVECQEASASCDDNSLLQNTTSPLVASPNPRVHHSLSQMLQADAIEWGNAENPPALIYQKDAPKGLKRLLKFARKSTNSSVNSDGEDELEESKAATSKRCSDRLGKSGLRERFDGQSKKSINYQGLHEILSVQSSAKNPTSPSSEKLREGHISTKAPRSFFSLSAFRSGKSSETKLR